jgi:hypothetical protein
MGSEAGSQFDPPLTHHVSRAANSIILCVLANSLWYELCHCQREVGGGRDGSDRLHF